MTHAYDSIDIALVRDAAAKKFSWFILPGRSMAFVRFDPSFVPKSPPKPEDISTGDRSKPSSAYWHLRGVAMLKPTLNPLLQAYFHSMQCIMLRTCHPSVIHYESRSIVYSVSAGLSRSKLSGDAMAKALFCAGTARLEYTRTVALVIHDVLVELNLSDWWTMRTLQMHIEDIATLTILKAWCDCLNDPMFTGLDRSTHSVQATRDEVFNAAAFYGDLVAIGVIPGILFNSVINGFLDCLTTLSQCRMLHLLLIRATFHLAYPINPDYLVVWRDRLLSPKLTKLPMGNGMVQRWLIELCNVIDKAIVRNEASMELSEHTYPPGTKHIWDVKLTAQGLRTVLREAGRICK